MLFEPGNKALADIEVRFFLNFKITFVLEQIYRRKILILSFEQQVLFIVNQGLLVQTCIRYARLDTITSDPAR